jgi:Rho-binding antiterminator
MNTPAPQYNPISCEFHDLLEALATTRKPAQILVRDEEGVERSLHAVIVDVYAREGSEYLSLDNGETIRLDRLVAVDGARLADY